MPRSVTPPDVQPPAAQPPEPGLFGAPLRDTGLFEPPVKEAGVVDLRPYDASSGVDSPAGALPHRPDRTWNRPPGGLGPDATHPQPLVRGTADAPFTPGPAGHGTPAGGTAAPGGRPALPRRTRQTHLSPRLRDLPAEEVEQGESTPDLPDADMARSRMTALQRGTLRGRATDPEA
jgi:hypothetical protein